MDLQYLRRLIKIFDESTAGELTIEEEGTKISLSRKLTEGAVAPAYTQIAVPQYAAVQPQANYAHNQANPQPTQAETLSESQAGEKAAEDKLHKINSPMVGTFYRAPSPDSASFVEIGDHITAGTTLCIVEAMKLMNEIESDISGTIVKILVENAEAVEYNQPMFLVKPD